MGKISTREGLAKEMERLRKEGKRIVFTNGCFDLLHIGHVRYLNEAKRLGDVLVVGLNSDRSVRSIKGPKRPIVGEDDRAEILAALKCVDYVTIFDEDTPWNLIAAVKPHILVKGGDWSLEGIVGADIVSQYGGKVVLVPVTEGKSTSVIIGRIIALEQG